ncbi:uncharacterized protein LOC129884198 [Solanum dulcamara]|uniref:uncharacterized protein LOC129884198 n=1 Tax=Solanum dulcamara TaxID=45834 RepID=UPI002485EB7C|nr:uncharacterized protein LOC129884198 [Solanum dulcamara]
MAPFKGLYGRSCHSQIGWFESSEPRTRTTYLLQEALARVRLIQDRLTPQSRHQSYADHRHRPLCFGVYDRYVPNESHVLKYDSVELNDHLTSVEEPVAILTKDVRQLRSRAIPIVKVN